MTNDEVAALGVQHGRECAEQVHQRYIDKYNHQKLSGKPSEECMDVVEWMLADIDCGGWSRTAQLRGNHIKLGVTDAQKNIYYNAYDRSAQERAIELVNQPNAT